LLAEVGHNRQQAEQHTGRHQQQGHQVRELNSQKSHCSFPKHHAEHAQRRTAARVASKSLSGNDHPLKAIAGAETQVKTP
jgi:hypothetical protein